MRIVIVGGGICGLGTALLLARDGHEVTVLERDADALPERVQDSWDAWGRKGVPQFRQPHNFMPGLRRLLEAELPDVQEALKAAGASRFDLMPPLPPSIADRTPRLIDEALWTYTARRPVGEWVFAQAAMTEPRVTVRRGVQVESLLAGPSAIAGVPHVAGVRTTAGDEVRADLVIDASGRYSRSPVWLQALGARPPHDEQADAGFAYYTRYFSGRQPERRGPTLMPLGTMSVLTLPADNGTWSVTVFTAAGDQPLKDLRHADKWMNVIRACPLQAHWLDGEATTDVLAMSGMVDRYRRFVVDGAPVVTGFVAVADAAACTNPSAGRGLTVGMLHALELRDVLRESSGSPAELVARFHERTESEIAPWYDAQRAMDTARFAEMEAVRDGRPAPPPSDELARAIGGLLMTMMTDADLVRAALEYIGTLTPAQQVLGRPGIQQKIRAGMEALMASPPPPMPGPDRRQLLDLLR